MQNHERWPLDHGRDLECWRPHSRALRPGLTPNGFRGIALAWGPAGMLESLRDSTVSYDKLMRHHEFPGQCISLASNASHKCPTACQIWTQHGISLVHLMQPASHFVTPLGVAKASTGRSCDSILGHDAGRLPFHWVGFREIFRKQCLSPSPSFSMIVTVPARILHIYAYLSCTICCDKSSWLRTMMRAEWNLLMTVPDFFNVEPKKGVRGKLRMECECLDSTSTCRSHCPQGPMAWRAACLQEDLQIWPLASHDTVCTSAQRIQKLFIWGANWKIGPGFPCQGPTAQDPRRPRRTGTDSSTAPSSVSMPHSTCAVSAARKWAETQGTFTKQWRIVGTQGDRKRKPGSLGF